MCEDRLIVERRAVVRVGQHLEHVVDGDHVQHARHPLRRAGVDRLDPAVRHSAAEQLGVEHPGQSHRVGVLGPPGDLVAPLEARQRAANLRADPGAVRIQRRHHRSTPIPLPTPFPRAFSCPGLSVPRPSVPRPSVPRPSVPKRLPRPRALGAAPRTPSRYADLGHFFPAGPTRLRLDDHRIRCV